MTALTVMDSHEHSVLRLVTGDSAKTLDVLKGLNMCDAEAEVILVELRSYRGRLPRLRGAGRREHQH